jgi:hypothetical protein
VVRLAVHYMIKNVGPTSGYYFPFFLFLQVLFNMNHDLHWQVRLEILQEF